ncbi:MAG TPA: hypothetical protein VLM17_10820, partial [Xanthomonadaceae bacterium]|nr:hypothetical protein [Xanthomonadaceae bacterium]
MTTTDQPLGRTAANRRPVRGFLRFLCCAVLGAAALPAFAQQAPAAPMTASTAAPVALPAPPAIDASLPLSDRAILLAGDLRRMVGAQSAIADAPKP